MSVFGGFIQRIETDRIRKKMSGCSSSVRVHVFFFKYLFYKIMKRRKLYSLLFENTQGIRMDDKEHQIVCERERENN